MNWCFPVYEEPNHLSLQAMYVLNCEVEQHIPIVLHQKPAEAQIGLLVQVGVMEIVKGELGLIFHRSNNTLSLAHTIAHEDTENCLINICFESSI